MKDDFVTTKEASAKVFLSQHRIAEKARQKEIVAYKVGENKWLVKLRFSNGGYELVKPGQPEETKPELEGGESARLKGFIPTEVKLDHWDRLVKAAETLYLSLGFPSQIVAPLVESRVGGLVWEHWGLKDSQVYFGGEREGLVWTGLLQHMDYEFSSLTSLDGKELSFCQTLKEFKKLVAPLVQGGDLDKARDHQLVHSLRDALDMVIERRTFKGSCLICQDWQK